MASREAAAAIGDGGINSGLGPEYFYDFNKRKVVLLGEIALEELITTQPYVQILLDKDKIAIAPEIEEASEGGVILPSLKDLITIPGIIPKDFKRKKRSEFSDLKNEDYLSYMRWLQVVAGLGEWAVRERMIKAAAVLGLGPSPDMIYYPKRFKTLTTLQQLAGQKGVMESEPPITEIDQWDLAMKLRRIADEEGQRPSKELLGDRTRRGLGGPSHDMFNRHHVSFPLALERMGVLQPRIWDKTKYGEWSYIFVDANSRIFTTSELNFLAPKALAPTSSSRGKMVKTFGSITNFQAYSMQYRSRRPQLALQSIRNDVRLNKLPEGLLEHDDSTDFINKMLRRAGRYKILDSLYPGISRWGKLHLSEEDFIGEALTSYLNSLGRPVPQWMAEAAAWEFNCLPDLFPHGELYQKLKHEKGGS